MKILSLHIENFGKLKNFDLVFKDGLNTICAENGWGKTTLASFIRAMFFGMDKKGNSKVYVADRSKYSPWQGGTYGGSMIFSANGKTYKVFRTFGPTPESDRFELIDVKTEKQSKDFSSNLGEELFGVGKETYSISTFFPQGMLEGEINDEVRSQLAGSGNLTSDVEMKTQAVKKLKTLSRELSVACPKANEILSKERNLEEDKNKLNLLEEERERVNEKISELRSSSQPLPQKSEKVNLKQSFASLREQEEQCQMQREKVELKIKKRKKAHFLAVIIPGMVILAALIAMCFVKALEAHRIVFFVLIGVSVLAMAFALFESNLVLNKKKKEQKAKIEHTQLYINKKKLELEQIFAQISQSEADQMQLFSKQASLEKDIAVMENSLDHLDREISLMMEEIDQQEGDIQQLRLKKEEIENKLFIVTSVIKFLDQAQENVSTRYVEPMQKKFSSIMEKLSSDKNILLDVDLKASVAMQTGHKEKQFLSRGKQDIVEISRRFALIESVFNKEKPCIILDDPFTNLDEKTLKNMLSLIKNFASENQILYLVCHSSRKIAS